MLLVLLVLLVMLVVLLIGMDLDVVRTNQRHLWWKVVVGVVMVMAGNSTQLWRRIASRPPLGLSPYGEAWPEIILRNLQLEDKESYFQDLRSFCLPGTKTTLTEEQITHSYPYSSFHIPLN